MTHIYYLRSSIGQKAQLNSLLRISSKQNHEPELKFLSLPAKVLLQGSSVSQTLFLLSRAAEVSVFPAGHQPRASSTPSKFTLSLPSHVSPRGHCDS